jgi:transcriptional regulator GlxA family with amidase domain
MQILKPLTFDSQPTDRFADLVAWIIRNLNEDLSANNLARRACMSPSHFNRMFKSVFGSTPAEFVENLRLNEAWRRLSSPRKTLQSVAELVGFSNGEEFRRAFEKRFGAKPGTYINNFKSRSADPLANNKVTSGVRAPEEYAETVAR